LSLIGLRGLPQSDTRGGIINLSIETDGDSELFPAWVTNPSIRKSGGIVLHGENIQNYLELEFENGYVIQYERTFDLERTPILIDNLRVSTQRIRTDNWEFENQWPS